MDSRDIKQGFHLKGRNLISTLMGEQTFLLDKYKEIEGLPTWPVDIDLPKGQVILKDFIARMAEEIVEAQEYLERMTPTVYDSELVSLMEEEVIDALHFYLGVYILAGLTPPQGVCSKDFPPTVTEQFYTVIYHAFLSRNFLKNKPWKQTQLLTDRDGFSSQLDKGFNCLMGIFEKSFKWTPNDIYQNYMQKHKVNQFRQRSKY